MFSHLRTVLWHEILLPENNQSNMMKTEKCQYVTFWIKAPSGSNSLFQVDY